MTAHSHTVIVPGCYRCDLNLDEVAWIAQEEAEQQAREAACASHDWADMSSKWETWRVCRMCRAEETE